jgi:tRNA threonylcarbamoyladenosine biosynthesis protein TsaE
MGDFFHVPILGPAGSTLPAMQPSDPAQPHPRPDAADSPAVREVVLDDEAATAALAARMARCLIAGMVVHLVGDLGVGKTTFVRGLLRGLGHTGRVRSPTFTLLEPYNLPSLTVYHFDFYRFSDQHEWQDAGFDEYFGSEGACLVEWPELAGARLPAADLRIVLAFADGQGTDTRRVLRLEAATEAGARCLTAAAAGC